MKTVANWREYLNIDRNILKLRGNFIYVQQNDVNGWWDKTYNVQDNSINKRQQLKEKKRLRAVNENEFLSMQAEEMEWGRRVALNTLSLTL